MGGGGERGERGDYCPHKKTEEEEAEEEVEQGLFSSSFVPEAPFRNVLIHSIVFTVPTTQRPYQYTVYIRTHDP